MAHINFNRGAIVRGYSLTVLMSAFAGVLAWILDAPSSCFLLAVVAASLLGGRGPAYVAIVLSSCAFEFIFLPPPFHILHNGSALLRMAIFVGALLVTEALLNAKRRSDLARLAIGEEFRSLAATCPDGIFISDDASRVLFANPALLRMFGTPVDEAVGRSASELWPGFDGLVSSGEFVATRADGNHFYAEATCGRFGNKTTVFLRDVSDRRAAEERLRSTEARLAKASQTAAISELAAAVVHEISQPLSAMVANGQACLRWLGSTPPNILDGRKSVERIVRDGKDAAEIVRGLRSLFRQSALVKATLDLQVVIREVLSLLEGKLQRDSIQLEVDLPPDLPGIEGDIIQLQQVFMNLLGNAMDALQDAAPPRRLTVRVRKVERVLLTEIIDNGPVPPDFATIFDPFVTTKAGGMGMGLAICRSIVKAHDGQLWGAARPGGGTVFSFALPSLKEDADEA